MTDVHIEDPMSDDVYAHLGVLFVRGARLTTQVIEQKRTIDELISERDSLLAAGEDLKRALDIAHDWEEKAKNVLERVRETVRNNRSVQSSFIETAMTGLGMEAKSDD